jgi:hypothetical protein
MPRPFSRSINLLVSCSRLFLLLETWLALFHCNRFRWATNTTSLDQTDTQLINWQERTLGFYSTYLQFLFSHSLSKNLVFFFRRGIPLRYLMIHELQRVGTQTHTLIDRFSLLFHALRTSAYHMVSLGGLLKESDWVCEMDGLQWNNDFVFTMEGLTAISHGCSA